MKSTSAETGMGVTSRPYEKSFEEKNMVPWGPPEVPRVPISGPHHAIFSKLDGPGPLGSGGYSHTSFSTGEFHGK